MGASGLVWALLLTLGWLVLVQTSGFCELPKRGGGGVEESWKATLLVTKAPCPEGRLPPLHTMWFLLSEAPLLGPGVLEEGGHHVTSPLGVKSLMSFPGELPSVTGRRCSGTLEERRGHEEAEGTTPHCASLLHNLTRPSLTHSVY